jgi:hypothetical protein
MMQYQVGFYPPENRDDAWLPEAQAVQRAYELFIQSPDDYPLVGVWDEDGNLVGIIVENEYFTP